jgi:ketosteroid isomerase-like protein
MQATSTLTNTQVVRDCYRYFSEGNIEELLNQLTDNVQWSVPGPREIPYAGIRQGKPSVREFFKQVEETEEVLKMEPREFIEQGNNVVALGYWEAKVKKTGRLAKSEWAMVFTLKDGKIARFQEYSDTYNSAEAHRNASGKSSGN